MKNVEVLLREHVQGVGRCGDVVSVSVGYARNFLLPRKLAIQATADNVKSMERRRDRLALDEAALAADVTARIQALSGVKLKTTEKADESGRLFGSVNAATVARLLAEAGHPVEERNVRLEHPIKEVGTYKVPVHVRDEKNAEVELVVEGASA